MRFARLLIVGGLAALLVVTLLSPSGLGQEATLSELRARLVGTSDPKTTDEILDVLAERIGRSSGFEDAGAFGDWLGTLPDETAGRARVRVRRAWAYVASSRVEEAKRILNTLLEGANPEERPVALGYLGEVARQAGEYERAFEYLTRAAREGYLNQFVVESARKAAYQMRQGSPSKTFEGLPAYVTAIDGFLEAFDHPSLRVVVARWLLDDYAAYAVPDRDRAKAWARSAAEHALAALRTAFASGADATLAFDAARALEEEDAETDGGTHRFDLLAWAYTLGNRPNDDSHELPAVIALLADAALHQGRFDLAHRLARQRLDISDSPLARRVLARLPPDIGEE